MDTPGCISEIVESKDEVNSVYHCPNSYSPLSIRLKRGEIGIKSPGYTAEDDLKQLIEAIDLRTSSRSSSPRLMGVRMAQSSVLKKPTTLGISQSSGIGISESVTLKQALRRLCISQASEMAAMKRFSKHIDPSGSSDAGTIKKSYAPVVVQAREPGLQRKKEEGDMVEFSLAPEERTVDSVGKATEGCQVSITESLSKTQVSSLHTSVSIPIAAPKTRIKDIIAPEEATAISSPKGIKAKTNTKASLSASETCQKSRKPNGSPRPVKPASKNKTSSKKKGKPESASAPGTPIRYADIKMTSKVPGKSKLACLKESIPLASSNTNSNGKIDSKPKKNVGNRADCTPDINAFKTTGVKFNESLREKGESSQSSKSSIGDYSCSTSISDESHQSSSSANGCRPHMSKDVRWVTIRNIVLQQGNIGLKNFNLLKKLGCGDIGTVYLAELSGTGCLFALKVMDIDFLISRKKMLRAQTEKEILEMLDHPFLPTLYAHFTADNLACLVMEYCPGGDLHVLRQKQPGRSFTEPGARFYVAEVLLALEYLHMLGVIYRDLKPENILVREDGHIMLSDFDLSLRCSVSPTVLKPSLVGAQEPARKNSGPCAENSCIDPICLQPSWVPGACFTPRLISSAVKSELASQAGQLPQLVVEPTDARSNSFVGTHEYLAPEIIRGDGHGSAVDWWMLGIFLYELLFGKTPFKGPGNEETLANVVSQTLRFPENPAVSFHARDLIRWLLAKEPENRLGYHVGAAEIKQHPFFNGLNWALIRCAAPPEVPGSYDPGTPVGMRKKKEGKCLDFGTNEEDVEFELF